MTDNALMPIKTILVFGHFDLEGGRSWVIRKGLQKHGYTLKFCRTEAKGIGAKYRDLWAQWQQYRGKVDAIYVPFLGHNFLPMLWWIKRREKIPIVFDGFLSLYDTAVNDRRLLASYSVWAWVNWLQDFLACRIPHIMLIDTPEYAQYFEKTFTALKVKLLPLPIGCRTDLFHPIAASGKDDAVFQVEFHGTFIPLQGIETILSAAKILQDQKERIRFTLIGKGQTYPVMRELANNLQLTNLEFTESLPMERIPQRIANADVCLGIFGETAKADRVIPTKAYEIMACGKPLITGDTTAARRVLRDGENALLTKPGDAQALADAILRLKANTELRETLGRNGRALTEKEFMPEKIVEPLVEWLKKQ